MEASERAELLERLKASRSKLLESLQGLTEDAWEFQPAQGRWSIHNCVEHVVLVENRLVKLIGKTLANAPEPEKKAQAAAKDAFLNDGSVVNRVQRFNAPEAVHPKNHWPEVSQLINEFKETRRRTMEFVARIEGDLRSHFSPHPALGDLDCYQWLLLLPLHCERHLAQMEEIKGDAGFSQQRSTHA